MYALDTNTISEIAKSAQDAALRRFFSATPSESLFLPVVVIGEIMSGIQMLPDGRKRDALVTLFTERVFPTFAGRVLVVDEHVADAYAELKSRTLRGGTTAADNDLWIAATCRRHAMTLVTRDRDFAAMQIPTLNPWRAS